MRSPASLMTCLLAAAALAALPACHKAPPPSADSDAKAEQWLTPDQLRSMQVVVQAASQQPVAALLTTSGRITFDDLRVAHVFSPVSGRVVRIQAQLGQHVAKGAALATLEAPDVGSALADEGKARADLVAAEHEVRRQRELTAAHAGAVRDLEAAEDNFLKAKAELERARQKARLFKRNAVDAVSQTITLISPIDGELLMRNVNPGIEVQGQLSGGTAPELFTIGSLDELWVLADVFEVDVPRIHVGAPVKVHVVAYPQQSFDAKVDWVSGMLDPATRSAKVRCILKNPDRKLLPEMFATVVISSDPHPALAVPRSAVVRQGDQTFVYIQAGQRENGMVRFEPRPVVVDEMEEGDLLPVLHGLSAGEPVVTSGAILLSQKS